MYRLIIATFFISLNVFAQNPISTINARPTATDINIFGEARSATATIAKIDNKAFGITVSVDYRAYSGKIERQIFSFPVEDASFIQRGKDLYLIYQGQEILLAHHEWWYSPSWIKSNNHIQLKANLTKVGSKKLTLNPQILIFE